MSSRLCAGKTLQMFIAKSLSLGAGNTTHFGGQKQNNGKKNSLVVNHWVLCCPTAGLKPGYTQMSSPFRFVFCFNLGDQAVKELLQMQREVKSCGLLTFIFFVRNARLHTTCRLHCNSCIVAYFTETFVCLIR